MNTLRQPATDPAILRANRRAVWRWWRELDDPDPGRAAAAAATRALLAPTVSFHEHDPMNRLDGVRGCFEGFKQPLRQAFRDRMERAQSLRARRRWARNDHA